MSNTVPREEIIQTNNYLYKPQRQTLPDSNRSVCPEREADVLGFGEGKPGRAHTGDQLHEKPVEVNVGGLLSWALVNVGR